MRVTSASASIARHGMKAVLEAGLLVAIAFALLFGVGPMFGAQPPSGASVDAGTLPTGTITLDGATLQAAVSSSGLRYGDKARFATEVSGRVSRGYFYIRTLCYQDGRIVYQWSADRDFAFPLVDQAGQNLDWNGGAASCTGELIYRIDRKGGSSDIHYLDEVGFDVAAQ